MRSGEHEWKSRERYFFFISLDYTFHKYLSLLDIFTRRPSWARQYRISCITSVFMPYLPPPLFATHIMIGYGSRGPNHLPRFASASLRFESSVNPMFLWSGLTLIQEGLGGDLFWRMVSESMPLLVCNIGTLESVRKIAHLLGLPGSRAQSSTIWCIPF